MEQSQRSIDAGFYGYPAKEKASFASPFSSSSASKTALPSASEPASAPGFLFNQRNLGGLQAPHGGHLQKLDPVLYLDISPSVFNSTNNDYNQEASDNRYGGLAKNEYHIQSVQLRQMRDTEFRLRQSKIIMNNQKEQQQIPKGPLQEATYQNPLLLSINTGVEPFLPPSYRSGAIATGKSQAPPLNPRLRRYQSTLVEDFSKQTISLDDEELDDDNLIDARSPTGNWIDPIVQIALQRQINKEAYTHRIIYNILFCLFFKLANTSLIWLDYLYRNHRLPFQNKFYPEIPALDGNFYISWIIKIVYGVFFLNILYSVHKLFQKQDQCIDLPLSNKQRALLGLELNNLSNSEDEETDFVAKKRTFEKTHSVAPKVKYTSNLSKYVMSYKPVVLLAIDLTYELAPVQKPLANFGLKKYSDEEIKKLNEKFRNTYDIDFDLQ